MKEKVEALVNELQALNQAGTIRPDQLKALRALDNALNHLNNDQAAQAQNPTPKPGSN
jgi:hypothetical protein